MAIPLYIIQHMLWPTDTLPPHFMNKLDNLINFIPMSAVMNKNPFLEKPSKVVKRILERTRDKNIQLYFYFDKSCQNMQKYTKGDQWWSTRN